MSDSIKGTPINLFFSKLLHFFAVLDLVDEDLRRLEAWNVVLVNHQRCVAGNIPCYLLFSFLVDKAAKTTDINVIAI